VRDKREANKNAYKWQTLTKEENELLKNLGSFSLIAFRQRLYLFGGKKGTTEGSNDLYWYRPACHLIFLHITPHICSLCMLRSNC
jgi:hypothetical protein